MDRLSDLVEILLGRRPGGVELRLEHAHERGRDVRVLGHRIVAVLLGVPCGHAHAVLAEGTQDLHVTPIEVGERDQPIQRIRFRLASPDRRDRRRDVVGFLAEVEHRAARVQHAEVVDVGLALAEHLRRDLLDRAKAQGLEDRHEGRQVDLAAVLVELHPSEPLAFHLVTDADEVPVGVRLEVLEREHVVDDQAPLVRGLVVARESRRVLLGQERPALGAYTLGQGVTQVVVPAAREPLDLRLQLLVGHLGDVRAGKHVHREEDASRFRLAERKVVVDRGPVELLQEVLLQTLAQRRVEPITRQRDDDRDAATVQVAADQHADAPMLLELQQADDKLAQLVGRGLEQLVLGERLEQLDGFLVVVRAGDQILGREDLLELVVKKRRLRSRLHVRLRGEQTDQPRLAGDHAPRVHDAHTDVVHAGASVHRGVRIRLREDEQIAALDAGPHDLVEPR